MILIAFCEELYSQHAAPNTVSQNTRQCTKLRNCEQEQHSVPWKYRVLERAPPDIVVHFVGCLLAKSSCRSKSTRMNI